MSGRLKCKDMNTNGGSNLDSFNPEAIHDLLYDIEDSNTSGNYSSDSDLELDACSVGLASLSRLNRHRNSIGRG